MLIGKSESIPSGEKSGAGKTVAVVVGLGAAAAALYWLSQRAQAQELQDCDIAAYHPNLHVDCPATGISGLTNSQNEWC